MNCEQADELMQRALDGELNEADREALEQHLSGCSQCRQAFDELQALAVGLERLAKRDPFADEELPSIGSERQPAIAPVVWRPWAYGAVGLAAGIALLFGLFGVLFNQPADEPVHVAVPEAIAPAFTPTIKLAAASRAAFMPVTVETDDPRVHIVWLYPKVAPPTQPNVQGNNKNQRHKEIGNESS